jgi:hypothetical protein
MVTGNDKSRIHESRRCRAGPRRQQGKKLLDQMRNVMRLKHYSLRTEQAYVDLKRLGNTGQASFLDKATSPRSTDEAAKSSTDYAPSEKQL